MANDRLLAIYFNDHLMGSVSAEELARRSLSNNRSSPLGQYLETFIEEILEDRRALLEMMEGVGVRPDPIKQAAGWLAEKAGRLKMNGSLLGYSDLSRLVELDALSLGVEGKLLGWVALIATEDPRLDVDRLRTLQKRARDQRTILERHRKRAAALAFRAGMEAA